MSVENILKCCKRNSFVTAISGIALGTILGSKIFERYDLPAIITKNNTVEIPVELPGIIQLPIQIPLTTQIWDLIASPFYFVKDNLVYFQVGSIFITMTSFAFYTLRMLRAGIIGINRLIRNDRPPNIVQPNQDVILQNRLKELERNLANANKREYENLNENSNQKFEQLKQEYNQKIEELKKQGTDNYNVQLKTRERIREEYKKMQKNIDDIRDSQIEANKGNSKMQDLIRKQSEMMKKAFEKIEEVEEQQNVNIFQAKGETLIIPNDRNRVNRLGQSRLELFLRDKINEGGEVRPKPVNYDAAKLFQETAEIWKKATKNIKPSRQEQETAQSISRGISSLFKTDRYLQMRGRYNLAQIGIDEERVLRIQIINNIKEIIKQINKYGVNRITIPNLDSVKLEDLKKYLESLITDIVLHVKHQYMKNESGNEINIMSYMQLPRNEFLLHPELGYDRYGSSLSDYFNEIIDVSTVELFRIQPHSIIDLNIIIDIDSRLGETQKISLFNDNYKISREDEQEYKRIKKIIIDSIKIENGIWSINLSAEEIAIFRLKLQKIENRSLQVIVYDDNI